MYPNLVDINTISLLRLAQRGDRALGKIRGDTLLAHSRTPHAVIGCLAVVIKYSRASGSAVSARVPSLSRVSSRFFALNDLGLSGLPHLAPGSQHGTLNRSRCLLAPPTIPRQFSFLSATRTTFRRLPQERVGLNCAHVPRSPSLWRVQARFRHAFPYPNAFRQTGQGVTLMLGLTPRHSCHPISQYGRGASARETSGRIACNRTCGCVRLATD